jgi:hypothetical protein
MEPPSQFGREPGSESGDAGGPTGLRGRLHGLFSLRTFLLAVVLSTAGVLVGGVAGGVLPIPLLGTAGRLLGLFVAAFVLGLVVADRRYVEAGLAGAVTAAVSFLLAALGAAFTGFFPVAADMLSRYGPTVAGVGAGTGLLVALVGYYFGRDLRNGLTREID